MTPWVCLFVFYTVPEADICQAVFRIHPDDVTSQMMSRISRTAATTEFRIPPSP
ncbi:hypothetical protein Plim_2679 [Planctopirus limnophila DSM 3776]|uniref:Uncharacterized protein n=1 Tax=Planctopirus limnophila (strain ATCC 43296 / DSM 3776 / IFAM 1008 / Mu 290) TaxID=521674 RepID=D5SQP0_PLAL2|nr:hypothetical protein Plim_2679 [Planctopirus limnophila DSM 3776]